MDYKKIFSLKNNKFKFILVLIIGVTFLIYESKESDSISTQNILLEKLDGDKSSIEKFDNFISEGYEKKISLPIEIMEKVIDSALTYLGTPNLVGGIDKNGIDSSGLIYTSIISNSDFKFPRIAQDMARFGKIITKKEDLKRGDLLFFYNTYETERIITSVGIYLGKNDFLISSTKKGVSINKLDDPYYWNKHFFFGTRIFR